jgi:hypothetical protein
LQQQPPLSSRLPCATGLCKTGRGQGHRAFGSDRRYRCGSRFRNIIRWCSPTSYHSESGRSLSHHRITDFDLPGDAPLYWFCLLSVIAESQLQVLNRVENCHSFKTAGREEARGVLRDGLSKIEHTARLRAATLASAASRCLCTAGNGAWRSGGSYAQSALPAHAGRKMPSFGAGDNRSRQRGRSSEDGTRSRELGERGRVRNPTRAEAAVAGTLYGAALNDLSLTWSESPVDQV